MLARNSDLTWRRAKQYARLAFLIPALCFLPALGDAKPKANPMPVFHTAAAARAWADHEARLGNYELAAVAYDDEAALRAREGDPQAAIVEHRKAARFSTDLALAIPVRAGDQPASRLAKFEPANGCYIGVLDEFASAYWGQSQANSENFARRLAHPVAVAYDYEAYGQPFPTDWARREADRGRAIQIAWEPNDIYAVQDDAYLNRWAEDAGASHTPIFLRFGGEMNGFWTSWGRNPAVYRRAFRLVRAVMARYAPNVAMVWAPNEVPTTNLDEYYPGDDAVDWVGISLYLPRFYDDNLSRPAWQDNPISFVAPFYAKYAGRKPLCITECGVSRRSQTEGKNADPFAADRIQDLMEAIKIRFPRLKMICFFDRNNIAGGPADRRLNDYSLPEGSIALDSLANEVADPYFLGRFGQDAPDRYLRVTNSFPKGYRGPVVGSISTYSLDPTLEIERNGRSFRVGRPYEFAMPAGTGPVTITVLDPHGHIAKTVTVFAP